MYQHAKTVPGISRRGQYVADAAGHRLISAVAPRAYSLSDASGGGAIRARLLGACRDRGFHFETVYDAAHGGRYLAIIFDYSVAPDHDTRAKENAGARKMAFDFITAPEHERYSRHDA